MTKPTMELVEEYGRRYGSKGQKERSDALLSEIRQRLEALERREAELESDLAEAAKCAFQYAAKVGELERDAARYRWLRGEVDGIALPLAQVVWKLSGNRESHNWTNLADGLSLDEHVDAAMAEGE